MLIVYTKSGCPWCNEVRAFLRKKQVPFEERLVTGHKAYFDELVGKSGQTQTPTLDLDGEILADTDAAAVEKFLGEKGMLS